MSMISHMSTTLTSHGTLRSMCTELGELVVQGNSIPLPVYESDSNWCIACVIYIGGYFQLIC